MKTLGLCIYLFSCFFVCFRQKIKSKYELSLLPKDSNIEKWYPLYNTETKNKNWEHNLVKKF